MVDQNDEMLDATEGGTGSPEPAPKQANAEGVDEARAALVRQWVKTVKESRDHWDDAFKRMRTCMKLATNGTSNDADAKAENGDYVVPITNRLVNLAVSTLYAKNPKAVAKRKDKLMYQLWDGDPASLQAAMAAAAVMAPVVDPMTGQPAIDPNTMQPVMQPADPNAVALLEEVQAVKQQLLMYDRMGETMGLLFNYFLQEQDSGYKEQFKALVRRTKVCGVGYVELDFQRTFKENPDIAAQIADTTSLIVSIEAGMAKMEKEGAEYNGASAEAEKLRLQIETLQNKLEVIAREGPVLGFPKSTSVIPSKECTHLKTFAGCPWVAREYDMTPERIKRVYGVDLGENYTCYTKDGAIGGDKKNGTARVWRIQDKESQQFLTVCDGYNDFLVAPAAPDVDIERFWTIFPLVFNEVESETEIFPPSDVWNARHMQREYNSARQGLREHRKAARPKWATTKGKLENADRLKLSNAAAFEIVELNSMAAGEKVGDILQAMQMPGVDPALYETESAFADIQRVTGAQEANLGGTSGDTATEASIAENSRGASNASDVDDLDTMLSALARGMGQLMLMELSKETVVEIAGPGAVWPDLPPTREQVVKDLVLEIEAGSSGRPNAAADLAKMERAMPYVTMLPGMNPRPIAKKYVGLLDLGSLEDAYVEGLPSIAAMNRMAGQPAVGAGPDDPNAQGDKGGDNAPGPEQADEPQPQPAFPAPEAGVA